MRAKKRSKHQVFVEAWCLEHEILPETLDTQHVDRAKLAYQNVARLLPEKQHIRVTNARNFGEWAWRSVTINHFIGQEETFTRYLLLMLHTKAEFFNYSNLTSEAKWQSLDSDIKGEGKKLLDRYTGLLDLHLRSVKSKISTAYDFPEHATYLESFLATRLYTEMWKFKDFTAALIVDEAGVFTNYAALVSSTYLLNIYCNSNKESEDSADARIIKSCARATNYLLCKQPEPYTKGFGKITPLCF